MSSLENNALYRIYPTSSLGNPLCAFTENPTNTAGVGLCGVILGDPNNGNDQWQVVQLPNSNSYAIRSQMLGPFSLLATFSNNSTDFNTLLRVEFEQSTTYFPLQTQWNMISAGTGQSTFYITNSANSSSSYMEESKGVIYMESLGSYSPSVTQAWNFFKIPTSSVVSSPTPSPSNLNVSGNSNSNDSGSGVSNTGHSLTSGTIAGIVLGILAAISLAAILLVLFRRKKMQRRRALFMVTRPARDEQIRLPSELQSDPGGKRSVELYADTSFSNGEKKSDERPAVELP